MGPLSDFDGCRRQSGKHLPQPYAVTFSNVVSVRPTPAYKSKKPLLRKLKAVAKFDQARQVQRAREYIEIRLVEPWTGVGDVDTLDGSDGFALDVPAFAA